MLHPLFHFFNLKTAPFLVNIHYPSLLFGHVVLIQISATVFLISFANLTAISRKTCDTAIKRPAEGNRTIT